MGQSNVLGRDGTPVECSSVGRQYLSSCPVCSGTIIIHCDVCSLQVTGCSCTLQERVGKELRNAPDS